MVMRADPIEPDKIVPAIEGLYELADEAFDMWVETRSDAARDEFRKHAQAEVDFLISLRETK